MKSQIHTIFKHYQNMDADSAEKALFIDMLGFRESGIKKFKRKTYLRDRDGRIEYVDRAGAKKEGLFVDFRYDWGYLDKEFKKAGKHRMEVYLHGTSMADVDSICSVINDLDLSKKISYDEADDIMTRACYLKATEIPHIVRQLMESGSSMNLNVSRLRNLYIMEPSNSVRVTLVGPPQGYAESVLSLRANSKVELIDYESLLRRYVKIRLGGEGMYNKLKVDGPVYYHEHGSSRGFFNCTELGVRLMLELCEYNKKLVKLQGALG